MSAFLTQRVIPGSQLPLRGIGNLGLENQTGDQAGGIFNQFISSAVGLMTIIAALWFLFIFLGGAYGIMSAGGDKGKYEAAQKRITTGLTGLIVVIAAIFILDLVGYLFGFDLILDPAQMINRIGI